MAQEKNLLCVALSRRIQPMKTIDLSVRLPGNLL
jgi:hypothetical protein